MDEEEGMSWLIQAAEVGNAEAQYRTGVCFEQGKGVVQSDEKAVEWYLKAADQGHAGAQCNLGICYIEGTGIVQNLNKAFEWWQKAADQGLPGAQCNLGQCYNGGQGVSQSYEKAVECWQKAADQGYARAQCSLAVCYSEGEGVAQSDEKAVEWWQKAADQGHAEAQANLASCYAQGKGVALNYEKGFEFSQKAADQGHARAQFSRGLFYQRGMGVAKDLKKAKRFFELSAKQGYAPAHAALAQLEAASGKDTGLQKAQKYTHKSRAADNSSNLASTASERKCSGRSKQVVQAVYEQTKLASHFRCHNEGCSVAYSEDVAVQSAKLKLCARCRKVAYCSVECQTADWKARHKKECGKMLEATGNDVGKDDNGLVKSAMKAAEHAEAESAVEEATCEVGMPVVAEGRAEVRVHGVATAGEEDNEEEAKAVDESKAASPVRRCRCCWRRRRAKTANAAGVAEARHASDDNDEDDDGNVGVGSYKPSGLG